MTHLKRLRVLLPSHLSMIWCLHGSRRLSLNIYHSHCLPYSKNGTLLPQLVVSQAQTLLQLTLSSMRNAIDAFYSPCAPLPLAVSQSLPSIDVSLLRLAGFMMQTQTPFTYQGKSINFPAPKPIYIAPLPSLSMGLSSSVYFSTPSSAVMLTESHYTQLPNPALQQQLYSTQ